MAIATTRRCPLSTRRARQRGGGRGRHSQRYLDAGLLHADLSRAGLMLLSLNGGFAEESYTPDSEHLVVRAARA